jgi:hypothetical protein
VPLTVEYSLKDTWDLGARGLSDCVEGQLERLKPRKKISQDWLQLDEGDHGFQLMTEEDIVAVIFLYFSSSPLPMSLNFPFIFFLSHSLSFRATFRFINPDCRLIPMTSSTLPSQLLRISEGLLKYHGI